MTVPAPPAPEAVLEECAVADLVIADKRHAHRLPRGVLERMTRCLLIQMPAVGHDVIDYVAAAGVGVAVANAGGDNPGAGADRTVMALLETVPAGVPGGPRGSGGG